ncbi:MAG: GTP-binding protein [Haliea sp.]|uniref:CobW family GTP-binding protein n=1 Tax=Haliea sp. TaxID=1932666 RepID=UPI0032EE62D7
MMHLIPFSDAPTATSERFVPVTVISGFLGSGKTTLLRHVLSSPDASDMAVIVNEFGEVGIDHLLLANVTEDIALLESGCLCCQAGENLGRTLQELDSARQQHGGQLSHVLIETSGLADPAPVMHALLGDPAINRRFQLRQLITVVDGAFGIGQLAEYPESRKQAMLADQILISKMDVATAAEIQSLQVELDALNPLALRLPVQHGCVVVDSLLNGPCRDPAERWATLGSSGPTHSKAGVGSESLVIGEALDWRRFSEWLSAFLHARGDDVLRVKGMLNVAGESSPVVIDGIQQVFYAPQKLPGWPDCSRDSRLVVIARHLPPGAVRRSLLASLAGGL